MSETAQHLPGSTVFVSTEEDGWSAMTILESRGFGANATIQAAPLDNPGAARQLSKEECVQILDADPMALRGSPDMVKFTKLSEAALLHNLRVRYARNEIYTRAGSILISVNPFKALQIYSAERMHEAKVSATSVTPMPPVR